MKLLLTAIVAASSSYATEYQASPSPVFSKITMKSAKGVAAPVLQSLADQTLRIQLNNASTCVEMVGCHDLDQDAKIAALEGAINALTTGSPGSTGLALLEVAAPRQASSSPAFSKMKMKSAAGVLGAEFQSLAEGTLRIELVDTSKCVEVAACHDRNQDDRITALFTAAEKAITAIDSTGLGALTQSQNAVSYQASTSWPVSKMTMKSATGVGAQFQSLADQTLRIQLGDTSKVSTWWVGWWVVDGSWGVGGGSWPAVN
jgi:hypothetical protein